MESKEREKIRKKRIITMEEAEVYSPPKHEGTLNYLFLSKETLGAKHLEIILGKPKKGGGGQPHFHSESEQAVFVLQGKVLTEIDGEKFEVGPNTLIFHPPNSMHGEVGLTDDAMVLVIYAPPIGVKDRKAFRSPKDIEK